VNADAEDAEAAPAPSTEPKKKKRKKRAAADVAPGTAGARAAAVAKRDDFAADWPAHPELVTLLAAFDAGNYALVRERGRALLAEKGASEAGAYRGVPLDARVRACIADLLRRIEPDRTAVILLGIALLLMTVLAWFYWTHPHGE